MTRRRFDSNALFLATKNQGKIDEFSQLLADKSADISFLCATDFPDIATPEETEDSFSGNALLKARYYSQQSGHITLADDSGLHVDALDGAPGIYSARWAEEAGSFAAAIERIQRETATHTAPLHAHFVCALALYWPDGHAELVESICTGTLRFPPSGEHGFGYDPIFIPDGLEHSFAELPKQTKQQISHRALACRELVADCF